MTFFDERKLTSKARKDLPASDFVFPKDGRYPIPDLAHARNALSRCSGTKDEARVRAAVHKRYPQLKKKKVDEAKTGIKGMKYLAKSSASDNDKFNKWAAPLVAKGYRHIAFNGDKFMLSLTPIPPGARNNGPYSRLTADTKPSLVRDTIMKRARSGMGESSKLIKEIESL